MSAPEAHGKQTLTDRLAQWLGRWKAAHGHREELDRLDRHELERIAADVGLNASDLCTLARHPADSAGLLEQRMASLGLEEAEVRRMAPLALNDLQRLCTLCDYHRRCAEDMSRDKTDPGWESYCPNVDTLKALSESASKLS